MADKKLVQKIQVPDATAERGVVVALKQAYVSLIEKCDTDQL